MTTAERTAQRIKHAVFHSALYRAKAAVKREIQAQGLRLCEFTAKEITLRAEDYLAQNREALLAEAMVVVELWIAEGFFGKRARQDWESVRKGCSDKPLPTWTRS